MYRKECENNNLTDMDHRDAFLSDTEAHCLKGSGITLVLVTVWKGSVGIAASHCWYQQSSNRRTFRVLIRSSCQIDSSPDVGGSISCLTPISTGEANPRTSCLVTELNEAGGLRTFVVMCIWGIGRPSLLRWGGSSVPSRW